MKFKSLLFFMLVGLVYSPAAFSQEEIVAVVVEEEEDEKAFTLSGSVDTYFHTQIGTARIAPGTSFANNKGFAIGMANLIASYSGEKAGFVADLVFGNRGTDAVFYSPYGSTSAQIVNQLYAYWKPVDNFTLTLGNFNTFLGYEVISPTLNFHYSTSYMFSYGPFSHTGIKANLEFGNGMNWLVAVMNPTDFTEFNPVSTYTLGTQLGYSNDNGGIWFNVLYGDQDGTLKEDGSIFNENGTSNGATFQADITTGWNLSESFYLGLNTSVQTTASGEEFVGSNIEDIGGDASSFFGFAVYPKLTISEAFALGFRAEYFSVKNSHLNPNATGFALTDGDGSVIDLTLSANIAVGNLMIIPEVRVDIASEDDSYTKKDSGEGTRILPTFNLAAVYKF